jgi:mannose-6-phosphate isomerase-like protein (cupin superfamily)
MSSPYTQTNLTEVDDSAPQFGFSELGEARFASGAVDAERTGLAYQRLNPDKRQPFGHKHENAEEVYVILGGGGRMKLDDDVIDVKRLDAIRVAPGVTRAFEAGPEGLEVLVFGARHEGDGEMIRDWWSD